MSVPAAFSRLSAARSMAVPMRIPLTVHGLFEVFLFSALLLGTAAVGALWVEGPGGWVMAGIALATWLFIMNFFRDPNRVPEAAGPGVVIAPADGKVTDIITVEDVPFVGGPATRIGIFLSVFDVHVNRSPVSGVVAHLEHRPGAYLDARDPACADLNEAQDLGLTVDDGHGGTFPVLVRQIAGLVARRIVCAARSGDALAAGQRYGMIKVGSRTEVYIPVDRVDSVHVEVGARVKGGRDLIARMKVAAEEPEGALQ